MPASNGSRNQATAANANPKGRRQASTLSTAKVSERFAGRSIIMPTMSMATQAFAFDSGRKRSANQAGSDSPQTMSTIMITYVSNGMEPTKPLSTVCSSERRARRLASRSVGRV